MFLQVDGGSKPFKPSQIKHRNSSEHLFFDHVGCPDGGMASIKIMAYQFDSSNGIFPYCRDCQKYTDLTEAQYDSIVRTDKWIAIRGGLRG